MDSVRILAEILAFASDAMLRAQAAREAAETSASRSQLLAEFGRALATSLDVEETLRTITRLAVPRLADWCALDVIEDDGSVRRVEVAHSDPEKEALAREVYRRYPADSGNRKPYALGLRRGEPIFVPDFDEPALRETARDDEHLRLLRAFGFRSVMCVPLVTRERLVGLVTLATAESGRRFTEDDLRLVTAVADRAALAIENARLFAQAQAVATARQEAMATVSHDLRSPLSVVSTSAMLLREPSLSTEERERALARIDRAVSGMERLVRDLLDAARLEAGAVRIERAPLPAEGLLAEACELVQPSADVRHVTVTWEAMPGLVLDGDRDRLLQVLGNLLENAVHHTPEGGKVQLLAARVPGGVRIAVADDGPGIPPELRERIFERFWQSTSRAQRGVGLGLAIARGLVELHGARLSLECPDTGGACFSFTIPEAPRREP